MTEAAQIGAARLEAALAATWPPAATRHLGPWTLREGRGGGSRVSAATAEGTPTAADVAEAEAAMAALGQPPLFRLRAGDAELDALLGDLGYRSADATDLLFAPLDLPPPTRLGAIPAWPPLAIQREIWVAGGIGPARIAVMERAAAPRTTLLGRVSDRAAGTAFVALHDGIAMVHAIEVLPAFRRRGAARHILMGAALWARQHGATGLGSLVVRNNAAAQALHASLGFRCVGQYHYRTKEEPTP